MYNDRNQNERVQPPAAVRDVLTDIFQRLKGTRTAEVQFAVLRERLNSKTATTEDLTQAVIPLIDSASGTLKMDHIDKLSPEARETAALSLLLIDALDVLTKESISLSPSHSTTTLASEIPDVNLKTLALRQLAEGWPLVHTQEHGAGFALPDELVAHLWSQNRFHFNQYPKAVDDQSIDADSLRWGIKAARLMSEYLSTAVSDGSPKLSPAIETQFRKALHGERRRQLGNQIQLLPKDVDLSEAAFHQLPGDSLREMCRDIVLIRASFSLVAAEMGKSVQTLSRVNINESPENRGEFSNLFEMLRGDFERGPSGIDNWRDATIASSLSNLHRLSEIDLKESYPSLFTSLQSAFTEPFRKNICGAMQEILCGQIRINNLPNNVEPFIPSGDVERDFADRLKIAKDNFSSTNPLFPVAASQIDGMTTLDELARNIFFSSGTRDALRELLQEKQPRSVESDQEFLEDDIFGQNDIDELFRLSEKVLEIHAEVFFNELHTHPTTTIFIERALHHYLRFEVGSCLVDYSASELLGGLYEELEEIATGISTSGPEAKDTFLREVADLGPTIEEVVDSAVDRLSTRFPFARGMADAERDNLRESLIRATREDFEQDRQRYIDYFASWIARR
jgi:hypothetical protein